MPSIRSPICACVGHVDHGKSSILDRIRGSTIVDTEAGAITQAIGASIVPLDVIKGICGGLLNTLGMDFTIPSLLFIDTPGHAAFTSLRKRGGSLADIAILVVDINEGFKPQTIEALEILKKSKTPFIIAANKIDLIPGFRGDTQVCGLLGNIMKQDQKIQLLLEEKLYTLVGSVAEKDLQSERFDRVNDYTKQIAIIPCSAKTGEGIAELLMVVAGLAQKYLETKLQCDLQGPAKGTILEIKEETGLGTTLNVIIYDGRLKINDNIVIGGVDGPIITKVKAMFEPAPLSEMRDKRSKFQSIKVAIAATGVKLSAKDTEDVIAGMPLRACTEEDIESVAEDIQNEVEENLIETDQDGVIVKADSIGSLEALVYMLREMEIPIMKARIGNISKKDLTDAECSFEKEPLNCVILGFNVDLGKDVTPNDKVKVISSDIIYRIVEDYEKWKEDESKRFEKEKLEHLTKPCKFELMKGYVFRQSNPAVCGVDILGGKMQTGMDIMKDGKTISTVKGIQLDNDSIKEAEAGKQVAVSMTSVTVGRQIQEGDTLYSAINENEFITYKKLKKLLKDDEKTILKEIAEIMRKNNPVWGV